MTDPVALLYNSIDITFLEAVMLGAVMFGHREMQAVIKAIKELAAEAGKAAWEWEAPAMNLEVQKQVTELAKAKTIEMLSMIVQKTITRCAWVTNDPSTAQRVMVF